MKYSFDTSALLDGWNRFYPRDVFPGLWEKIEGLIEAQEIIATEEVKIELEKKDDDLLKWIKGHNGFFIPIDEPIQTAVIEILGRYPQLLKASSGRSGADPFVIGLAKVRNLKVVSGERPSSSPNKPKIPDVARSENIECLTFMEFIREQRWSF